MFKGRIYSGSWMQIRHFSFRLFRPGIYDFSRPSVDPWWPERVRNGSKHVACPKKIAFGDRKGVFFFLHIFLLVVGIIILRSHL